MDKKETELWEYIILGVLWLLAFIYVVVSAGIILALFAILSHATG